MNKHEYFSRAIQNKAYINTSFVISLFSLYTPKDIDQAPPYTLISNQDRQYFIDPETGTEITVNHFKGGKREALFEPMDRCIVTPSMLKNVEKPIETTVGNVIFNAYVLVESIGDRLPFQTGKVDGKSILAHIEENLVSDGEAKKPSDIEVHEFEKFATYLMALEGLSQVTTPSGSRESFTAHPDRMKVRAELLHKYKDQLDDPVIIAKIAQELENLDREHIKGSPSEGFYISDKAYKVTRQRQHYMHGAEATADSSKVTLIEKSLAEGIEVKHLPKIISTQRRGSYSRGQETALGGEMVKYFLRVFQNITIIDTDCKTKLTHAFKVKPWNAGLLVQSYHMKNGKPELITKEISKSLIGKTIQLRLGSLCDAKHNQLCSICMGAANAANPNSTAELASNVPTASLLASMSAMHGNSLSVVDYDLFDRLS